MSEEEKARRKIERQKKKWNEVHKIINGVDYKVCSICKEWFVSTEECFYKNNSNKTDGLSPYCRKCFIKKSINYKNDNYERHKYLCKVWRENNREYKNSLTRKWIRRNREHVREYMSKWQDENPDKLKEYNNRKIQNRTHEISTDEWRLCKEYFNNECAYCGLYIEDHYVMYKGKQKKTDFHKEHVNHQGSNTIENCVPSCKSCNVNKWLYSLEEWYREDNEYLDSFSEERLQKIYKWLDEDHKTFLNSL